MREDTRHRAASDIFLEACDLPESERATFLSARCGSDEDLRREVERLLAIDAGDPESGTSAREITPGARFGPFRIRHELGRGGMGVVYLAERCVSEESDGALVALKVLPESVLLLERTVERFRREAEVIQRLEHPGIVRCLEHGRVGSSWYLAMEYIDGEDLAAFLARREFELDRQRIREYVDEAVGIVADAAQALSLAHECGVLHRDVKPKNILVDAEGRGRVVDFGLARQLDRESLTRTGEFGGSVHYMSPEQGFAKRVPVDHRTDVFSLGVVLYEALAMRRPFEGETSQQVAQSIAFEDPPALASVRPGIPRELDTICRKALEKRPADRYSTMDEMAADLRRFQRLEPIGVRPPSALRRGARWVARHPLTATSSAFAAVLIVLLASLVAQKLRADREVRANDRAEARKLFVDALLRAQGDAPDLGIGPAREKSRRAAIEDLLRVHALDPDFVEADFHRAVLLAELEEFDAARSIVAELRGQDAFDGRILDWFEGYLKGGRHEGFVPPVEAGDALRAIDTHVRRFYVGRGFMLKQNRESARRVLASIPSDSPYRIPALLISAIAWMRGEGKDRVAAFGILETVRSYAPENPQILVNYSTCLRELRENKEDGVPRPLIGKAWFDQITAMLVESTERVDHAPLWNNLAALRGLQGGGWAELRPFYERAVDADPASWPFVRNLAQTYLDEAVTLGLEGPKAAAALEEAVRLARVAIEVGGGAELPRITLAQALYYSGDDEGAARLGRELVESTEKIVRIRARELMRALGRD